MYDPVGEGMKKIGNRFMLTSVVSRRWEQLVTGGRPMVESIDPRSIRVVFKELEDEKLVLDRENETIERLGEPVEPPVSHEAPARPEEEVETVAAAGALEEDVEVEEIIEEIEVEDGEDVEDGEIIVTETTEEQ